MKQAVENSSIFALYSSWIKQFESGEIVEKIANLFEFAALYIIDEKQRLLLWNRSAEKILGHKAEDVLGLPCADEYRIAESRKITQRNLKVPEANGKKLTVLQVSQALFNDSGEFAGGISMLLPEMGITKSLLQSKKNRGEEKKDFHGLISRSPAMQPVFQIIQNAALTEATVLVRGESGSGKELVAKAIHSLSSRSAEPFLAINCAALSVNLLESELFGHVRGAFSGAIKDHSGLFQRADGGTLFLDEVAELPLELQAKLLRVVQERNYIPVGGDKTISVDVRIVAATHRSLRDEVKNGRFREDLMYRLRVVPIFIPALRERREDISVLLWHFINQHNAGNYRKIDKIDPHAMKALLDYSWPGNVRELQNVVEYAFAVGRGVVLRLSELPPEFREPVDRQPKAIPGEVILSRDEEVTRIHHALQQCNGKVSQAARMLGMSRATFWRKRKLYEL